MQTIKKIPGMALESETVQGGFYTDTVEQPNPGLNIMKTKICSKCEIEKPLTEFHKNKTAKDGLGNWCKKCYKTYYEKNKEKKKVYSKTYWEKNKEKYRAYDKTYQGKNKKKIREYKKTYREKNGEKVRKYDREYAKNYRRNNLSIRLNNNISRRIRQSLKGKKNGNHWEDLVGYTCQDLREHLEKQFKDGMSWELFMQGKIHIDHRIPISLFNIKGAKSKGFKACWALENLQPLWEKENMEKSNKLFY